MKLVRLEIRNYRSIKEQTGDDGIVFHGVDCLVGKNNAGKSNILKAICYLLGEEDLEKDLHYGRDASSVIDVRGFFKVDDSDFDLLKIENKRQNVKELMLEDGTIGICRRSSRNDMEVIRYYPEEERLRLDSFESFHARVWRERDSKQDFKDCMSCKYPELLAFLTEGKESNKGEWPDAYERFLRKRPEDVKFIKLPGPSPTGISADLKNILPHMIFIPAVKEVSDATKTTRTGELGRLLSELSAQVAEELDEAISQSMQEVYRRLNIVKDPETGENVDERDSGIKAIESQIAHYTSETFQNIGIRLEFPNPESKVMFDNARVWIREQGLDKVPIDSTGEGVKRVLIFSLLRTLADLRQGELPLSDDRGAGQPREAHPPLLILYEEAELFLHPGLQKILLKAFADLKRSSAQVVFTTHSPFMLQNRSLSTINLVNKTPEAGTRVVGLHAKMEPMGPKSQNRLLQVQNVSSYVFADRVVLVEGVSDRIVLRKIAPALRSVWDFERNGIPILTVVGKGNLPLFKDFLEALGIEAFVLTDVDSVKSLLPRLCPRDDIRAIQSELLQKCDELVQNGECEARVNKKSVSKLVSSYNWDGVFDVLERLCEALQAEEEPTEQQIGCLQRLVAYRETSARTWVLKSDYPEVVEIRTRLAESVLEDNILLLSGTIEDYYPCEGGNKIEAALSFDPTDCTRDELCSCFTCIGDGDTTDMEAFLGQVFANG